MRGNMQDNITYYATCEAIKNARQHARQYNILCNMRGNKKYDATCKAKMRGIFFPKFPVCRAAAAGRVELLAVFPEVGEGGHMNMMNANALNSRRPGSARRYAARAASRACGSPLRSGMDTVLASAKAVSMAKGSAVASRAEPATRPVPTPLLKPRW
jgi:hypothetical protein